MKYSDAEGATFIVKLLKEKGELSTWELEKELKLRDAECPDELVRFLIRLKRKGLINGEVSKEKMGWVWRV